MPVFIQILCFCLSIAKIPRKGVFSIDAIYWQYRAVWEKLKSVAGEYKIFFIHKSLYFIVFLKIFDVVYGLYLTSGNL